MPNNGIWEWIIVAIILLTAFSIGPVIAVSVKWVIEQVRRTQMTNLKRSLTRSSKCTTCINPNAQQYDQNKMYCEHCILTLLLTTIRGTGLTKTKDKIIWITRVILQLRKVLSWAITERKRLEEMGVQEFLSSFTEKGKEK